MPAFPVPLPKGEFSPDECLAIIERSRGMTLRQHYAGLAMQGLLACPGIDGPYDEIAAHAVNAADSLIAELAKPVTP